MAHYQTLNPNRESDRVQFDALSTVHWTKPVTALTEHHAMAGSTSKHMVSKTSAGGGASASASSASASTSTAKGTFTVRTKISVY